jgi:hypothetical protein
MGITVWDMFQVKTRNPTWRITKAKKGLGTRLKWHTDCLIKARPWVQTPVLLKERKERKKEKMLKSCEYYSSFWVQKLNFKLEQVAGKGCEESSPCSWGPSSSSKALAHLFCVCPGCAMTRTECGRAACPVAHPASRFSQPPNRKDFRPVSLA